MQLFIITLILTLLFDYFVPWTLFSGEAIFWRSGNTSIIATFTFFLILFFSLILILIRNYNFVISSNYKFSLRNYNLFFNLILIFLYISASFMYLKFGNSLRAITPGEKGIYGAIAFFTYALTQAIAFFAILLNKKRFLFFMIPIFFLVSNGTYGYLSLLAIVAFVFSDQIKLNFQKLLFISPFAVFLILLGVFYSKEKSIENLIELVNSDYIFVFYDRLLERINVYNYIASYELLHPHKCKIFSSMYDEYIWGFSRLGIIDIETIPETFSQCTYAHFANHELSLGSGASIGLIGSLFNFNVFVVLLVVSLLIILILIIVVEILHSINHTYYSKLAANIYFILFFLPLLNSAGDAFIVFKVSGLKLFLLFLLWFIFGKLLRKEKN
jgi:hypothetical protein